MKSILDIQIAVKEAQPDITEEELRLCIEAQTNMEHFLRTALVDLIEAIAELRSMEVLRMKSGIHKGMLDRLRKAQKMSPKDWLGPDNIPGTPAMQERLASGKRLFKKVTGIDL